MQGFSQAVLEDYGDKLGPEGKEHLERIQAAAARQDHFIRDVLAYSRVVRQDLRLGPVDLDHLVNEVIAEYPNLAQAREQIALRHPLGVALGHAPSLVQCLSNLLGNALKFVTPGTTPVVKVWSENRGDHVRLWVQDNGLGIAREQQPRLFRLFDGLYPP
jgi:signal transduction histidine kinase